MTITGVTGSTKDVHKLFNLTKDEYQSLISKIGDEREQKRIAHDYKNRSDLYLKNPVHYAILKITKDFEYTYFEHIYTNMKDILSFVNEETNEVHFIEISNNKDDETYILNLIPISCQRDKRVIMPYLKKRETIELTGGYDIRKLLRKFQLNFNMRWSDVSQMFDWSDKEVLNYLGQFYNFTNCAIQIYDNEGTIY